MIFRILTLLTAFSFSFFFKDFHNLYAAYFQSSIIFGKKYFVSSIHSGKCLDVTNNSQEQGAGVQLWDCSHTKNQEVQLTQSAQDPEEFELVFQHSQKCLSLVADNAHNGMQLIQEDCSHKRSQTFKIDSSGSKFVIKTALKQCLDVKDGSKLNGTPLQIWDCASDNVNQEFFFYPVPKLEKERPYLVTFQNNPDDLNTKNLEKTLKHWNWDYKIVGLGTQWKGFGTKFIGYLQELQAMENKNRIIILTDSQDVLANGSPEDFQKHFSRISQWNGTNRIISSAEQACCSHPMNYNIPGDFINLDGSRKKNASHDPNQKYDENMTLQWKSAMRQIQEQEGYNSFNVLDNYLNSGMIAGRAIDLIQMLEHVKAQSNEHDQALVSEYFIQFPSRVQLDYGNLLFTNAHGWLDWNSLEGCPYHWNGRKFIHSQTKSSPTLIQTPAKYWTCYNELLREVEKL